VRRTRAPCFKGFAVGKTSTSTSTRRVAPSVSRARTVSPRVTSRNIDAAQIDRRALAGHRFG
jgi:hypothetical protein